MRLKYGWNVVNTGKGRRPRSTMGNDPPRARHDGMPSRMRAIIKLFVADSLVVV